MNKRRLLKLADLLEADAKNKNGIKFDLGTWGCTFDNTGVSYSCGTTACAIGLAVVSGAFKRAGLTNYNPNYNPRDITRSSILPVFNGKTGFFATAELFAISEDEAQFLFSDEYYGSAVTVGARGERNVARRIRKFVAAGR